MDLPSPYENNGITGTEESRFKLITNQAVIYQWALAAFVDWELTRNGTVDETWKYTKAAFVWAPSLLPRQEQEIVLNTESKKGDLDIWIYAD